MCYTHTHINHHQEARPKTDRERRKSKRADDWRVQTKERVSALRCVSAWGMGACGIRGCTHLKHTMNVQCARQQSGVRREDCTVSTLAASSVVDHEKMTWMAHRCVSSQQLNKRSFTTSTAHHLVLGLGEIIIIICLPITLGGESRSPSSSSSPAMRIMISLPTSA